MPANVSGGAVPFPVRGVLGGWRDPWDDPDDHAALRAEVEATERRQMRRAEVLGVGNGGARGRRRLGSV